MSSTLRDGAGWKKNDKGEKGKYLYHPLELFYGYFLLCPYARLPIVPYVFQKKEQMKCGGTWRSNHGDQRGI